MVRIAQTRDAPLYKARDPGEQPIGVVWSLYGRPSDLLLVDRYARRLGVTVSWRPTVSGRKQGSENLKVISQEVE
jgi:hypothetical protein